MTRNLEISKNKIRKKNPEIWKSQVRRPGNLEWNDLGISSETTWEKLSGYLEDTGRLAWSRIRHRAKRKVGRVAVPVPVPAPGQPPDISRVVSLEIPRSFHSRFPGRFTRDSRVVSLEIPVPDPPFVKNRFLYRKIDFFIVKIIGNKFPKFSYI